MPWKAAHPFQLPPPPDAAARRPTREIRAPKFFWCSSCVFSTGIVRSAGLSLEFANGAADSPKIGNSHLLVFPGHDNPVRAGIESLDHTLVDLLRIGVHVLVPPRYIEADAGIDFGPAFSGRDASLRLPKDIIR